MRLWCQLWVPLHLEDPRFRPHTWEKTHSSVSKDCLVCWSLVGGLRGRVISGSLFLSMSVSTRKLPQIMFGVKNPLSIQTHHVVTNRTSSSACHLATNGLMFFVCSWRVSIFFRLHSLKTQKLFCQKNSLSTVQFCSS